MCDKCREIEEFFYFFVGLVIVYFLSIGPWSIEKQIERSFKELNKPYKLKKT